MKRFNFFVQLACLLFIVQGCNYLRFLPCKNKSITLFSSSVLSGNSPFHSQERTFRFNGERVREVIRLPDSLGGLNISGRLDADVMLSSQNEVEEVVVNALDLTKGKNKRFFHNYFPECQKRPFRKKYHERVMVFIKQEAEKLNYEQVRSIPASELLKDTLYPTFVMFTITNLTKEEYRKYERSLDSLYNLPLGKGRY